MNTNEMNPSEKPDTSPVPEPSPAPDYWEKPADEPPSIWDKPANVTRLYYSVFIVCGILAAVDLFYHKHVHYEVENIIGAFGIYGFVSCVLLVLVAKELRKILIRREDYYDHDIE